MFYRIQQANDPATRILEPGQRSYDWNGLDEYRNGVSACESIEELGTYLAQVGIPYGDGDWNLIAFEGHYANEDDLDAHLGAVLTEPTAIISVEPMADNAETWEAIDAAFEMTA